MTYARPDLTGDPDTIPRMPPWVTRRGLETPETVAFLSGAALSHLHLVVTHKSIPQTLLRDRLALAATEACMTRAGRPERAGELRDAVAFLQPGDPPGPAGDIYLSWRRAVARPVSAQALHRALPDLAPEQIAKMLDLGGAGQGGPVARAAAVLETVLAEMPREEVSALILADAVLARACGWPQVVPLLASGLSARELRKPGDDLRLASHRTVLAAAAEVTRTAAELARRADRLRAVTPKLRARGAGAAVQIFLKCDAVAPSALPLPDRAARRLCDRLVDLGAIRELTGRDTFRLYGL